MSLLSELVVISDGVPIAGVNNPKVEVSALLSGTGQDIVLILLNHDYQFSAETFSPNPARNLQGKICLPQ